jgi:hypothetical protein
MITKGKLTNAKLKSLSLICSPHRVTTRGNEYGFVLLTSIYVKTIISLQNLLIENNMYSSFKLHIQLLLDIDGVSNPEKRDTVQVNHKFDRPTIL